MTLKIIHQNYREEEKAKAKRKKRKKKERQGTNHLSAVIGYPLKIDKRTLE